MTHVADVLSKALSDLIDILREDTLSRSNPGPYTGADDAGGPGVPDVSPAVSTVTCFDGATRRQIQLWSVLYSDDDGPYVASYVTKAEADGFNRDIDDEGTVVCHFVYLP